MTGDRDSEDAGPYVTVCSLNRYADPLPEDYRENFDVEECAKGAESLRSYVASLVSDGSAAVEVSTEGKVINISHASGRSLEVTIFDYEAMDAVYTPLASDGSHPDTPLLILFSGLDRCGTAFLVQQIVEMGRVDVDAGDQE